METTDNKYITAQEIAKMFGLSVRRVQQYRADGALVTVRTPQGLRYDRDASMVAWIKYFLRRCDARDAKQRIDIATAKLRERQAERERIRLKILKGEVHEARHVKAVVSNLVLEFRAALLSFPNHMAPDLANCKDVYEVAAVLKKGIYDLLRSLANRKYDPEEFARLLEEEGGVIDRYPDEDFDEDDEAPDEEPQTTPKKI